MYKKFLLPISLVFIASCTMPWSSEPKDFSGMYQSHVKSQVQALREVAEKIGYLQNYKTVGKIALSGAVPGVMSGSINADYTANVKDRDASIDVSHLQAIYTSLMSSGSLRADQASFISKSGDAFFRIAGLTATDILPPDTVALLQKYDGKWLSQTAADRLIALSGATEEERVQYQVGEMFSKMTLDDIEGYLTKYPLWKETADLGMSGSLQGYSVELDRANLLALIEDFTTKATGKGLSQESRDKFTQDISQINITGNTYFDPAESRTANFSGALTTSGSVAPIATFQIGTTPHSLTLQSVAQGNTFTLNYQTTDTVSTLVASLSASGSEIGKWNLQVTQDGKRVARVDSVFTAQGLTATLVHTNNTDGSFSGSLNFGIGNTSWEGKIASDTLTDLHMKGAMIGSMFSLDLVPTTDGLISGPLVVKSGDAELARAMVGLRAMAERFSLSLDVADTTGTGGSLGNIFLDITGKKSGSDAISTPTPTTPFQTLLDEMGTLTDSASPFVEEDITGSQIDLSGSVQ